MESLAPEVPDSLTAALLKASERTFDVGAEGVRVLNQFLHDAPEAVGVRHVRVLNPNGAHNIAVGAMSDLEIEVHGHAGYYLAGMNQLARVTVHGNVGWGVAENMMSGSVRVKGFASESAGASAHGGLLVIEGDTSLRCGISLKGADIVVGGSVGSFSAFMAQAGRLVVLGDAGDALGDSLYEAVIYVRGRIKSLGADAEEQSMTEIDQAELAVLLERAQLDADPAEFRRIGSRRALYHWNADANQQY